MKKLLKNKKCYMILTILFSLLLLADLLIGLFVPTRQADVGGMGNFSDMEMPEGFDGGQMPGGFDFGEMPEGFDSGQMPGGFDFEEMLGTEAGNGKTQETANDSFLQKIKEIWLPICVVLCVLDGFSIFMWVHLARKEKEERFPGLPDVAATASIKRISDKRQRIHFTGVIVLVGMGVLVWIVQVMTSQSQREMPRTEATIHSGTAEFADLETIVPGTGTLEEEEAVVLELPSDVKITDWYVANGDSVKEGEKLAQVETGSVMSSIVSIQDKIRKLDEELAEQEDAVIEDTITAAAAGRVKAIYAEKGQDVLDVMYDSEALILISLDGFMTVSVETEAEVSAGDPVQVTLSDGTVVSGRMESILNGIGVVTISDEKAEYKDTVTVTAEDGTLLGNGKLAIRSELRITGYAGTVAEVAVSVNQKVSAGQTLISLTDTSYTGKYETLLAQRMKLEEQIQTLFLYYQDSYIYAACDGVISGLDEDLAAGNGKAAAMSLVISQEESEAGESSERESESEENLEKESEEESSEESDENQENIPENTYVNYVGLVSGVTKEGDQVLVELGLPGNSRKITLEASCYVYTFSGSKYEVGKAADIQENDILMLVYEEGMETKPVVCVRVVAQTDEKTEGSKEPEGAVPEADSSDNQQMPGTSEVFPNMQGGNSLSEGTQSSGSLPMMENDDQWAEEVQNDYGVTTKTWLSIIPQDTMQITITVDEMDILSLEEGQKAQITLDAFPGQSFEGTVDEVLLSGTNSGGSSKYQAIITMNREENMLAGMNASVGIRIAVKESILTVPAEALQETEDGMYLYTSYDEKTESLKDPVKVTTGLSDGKQVEILEGLEEGSEYWYSYLDQVNANVLFDFSGGGFGGFSLFGEGRP